MPTTVVAIAGASGFVGSHLAQALAPHYRVIGLSRSSAKKPRGGIAEWRGCDLFSLRDAEQALLGVDIAIYLVHSMMPSAHLTQGGFENLDLIAADNFARAASKNGVKQIVYLGGLIPESASLSKHLQSRLEVEQTLAAYGIPVAALRAGLIVGNEGSSFQILYRLVKRLPVMLCPKWTQTKTQPIHIDDAVALLSYCVGNSSTYGEVYDIGGPEVLTYRDMIATLARLMGLKRWLIRVPLLSPGLSRLWVSLVTGAPKVLVAPLVQSLKHPMIAGDRRLQSKAGIPGTPFVEAMKMALEETKAAQSPLAFRGSPASQSEPEVRSVQRLRLPRGRTAQWVGEEYLRWLPNRFFPIRVEVKEDCAKFYLRLLPWPLLVLEYSRERSTPDRSLFYIVGGLLVRTTKRGRFEFRESWNGEFLLAAVHEFRPRLPWRLYSLTQAKAHLYVMWRFGKWLDSR